MPDAESWLVVGLGNPGPTYAGTRHNVGYLVTDELARRMSGSWRTHKTGHADVIEGRLGPPGTDAPRVVLARARCYMNESGGPVKALAKFYKVPPERIVAVPRRAGHPLRHAAHQARRWRQRPQRAALDAVLARHR